MKKWYGLYVSPMEEPEDTSLISVKEFDSDHLPDLNNVEDFRLWDVPFFRMLNYQVHELEIDCRNIDPVASCQAVG